MSISRIGVVGAGTMGQGIAQVLITSHHQVALYDVSDDALASAKEKIGKGLPGWSIRTS